MKGFSPLRDLPAVGWLLAVVVVALAHPVIPAPRWLLFHLLLLGAATHSILVWSQHFADTLLHTVATPAQTRVRSLRLAALNVGVVLVVAGVVSDRWPVTAVGAAAVGVVAAWHAVSLVAQLRRTVSLSASARFAVTVRYYVAAGALLPVGAYLGVLMARGLAHDDHAQAMVAHVVINVLGWIGLTVTGTLVTLWPTILRTRVADTAVSTARRALPVLLAGLAMALAGCLIGSRPLTGAGLLAYAGGLVLLILPHVTEARAKPPAHFPGWSVLAGMSWFVLTVATLGVAIATSGDWEEAHTWLERATPALAAGFVAQVLLGALSYLMPVAVGRGPAGTRAANTEFDRAASLRIAVVNGGLALWLLPSTPPVRVVVSTLVLLALASFLPLMIRAIRSARRAATEASTAPAGPRPHGPAPVSAVVSTRRRLGQAVTGLAVLTLAVAIGVAVDPQALGGDQRSAAAGVAATGRTTTVKVTAKDMRFHPASVTVPAGDKLVIELTNTDDGDVHDLVLDSGADSGRLAPGESTRLDVGVVGRSLDGWCSVLGHRQMGMVFTVRVSGNVSGSAARQGEAGDQSQHQHGSHDHGGHSSSTPSASPTRQPEAPAFTPYDASLPAVAGSRVHRQTFTVNEGRHEVAPGVTQELWTYNGTAPGPVLHGKVGDRFEITLVNDGTMGHSIDFHAGERAPDEVMRTIPPGESLTYRFTATRAGIWMYHCSTMPMAAHIANGLFGAVVIDPPDLAPVDRTYVLVQSELYLGKDGGPVDVDKLADEKPDLVVFNGYANQYDEHPLTARVGERVRIWVLDAGPNRASSFHVVGGQFDTVWSEGAYRLRPGAGGAQVLPLLPAQGGFVELSLPEPGHYPFVSHIMADAERGAHGILEVTR